LFVLFVLTFILVYRRIRSFVHSRSLEPQSCIFFVGLFKQSLAFLSKFWLFIATFGFF